MLPGGLSRGIFVVALCSVYLCESKAVYGPQEEEKPVGGDNPSDDISRPKQMALKSSECNLFPYDPNIPERLRKLVVTGSMHLIKYEIEFPEYGDVPLRSEDNTTLNYKANIWYRVFSSHGKKLLTMAFNYDALSLSLLKYGVKKMAVAVVDAPPRCFDALTESDRMASVLRLLLRDLESNDKLAKGSLPWEAERDAVCHQVIESDDGKAKVVFRCCTRSGTGGDQAECATVERDYVIDALYVILGLLKIGFVLFGPIFLQRLLFEGSTKKTSYIIPIMGDNGLKKTLLVKKVRAVEDESTSSGYGRRKDMKQFTQFRKLVKTIPSEAIVPVRFHRLDILVDHKELMTEGDVPVGLLRFIYDTFIRCGITQVEPLKSCCQESIFGSWTPRFLWLKLRKRCDCNRGCRETFSWSTIFHFLGVVVLILVIPFPYYLRLAAFYAFEDDEVKERREAFDRLELDYTIDHNAIQWLTPTHASLITIYIIYLASLLLLSALRICDTSKIDGIARACVTDMRHIRQSECLRMLCAHIFLPFEKFGVFGLAVAALYWPFVLPTCVLITVFYCVPLVYLTGRLLVNARPGCCRRKPLPTSSGRSGNSISGGVTSFDSCFFLDTISPDSRPYSSVSPDGNETAKKSRQKNAFIYRQKLVSGVGTFLVGLLMLLAAFSILVMYSEAFGFLVEVSVLTTLGAIVNSDRSVQYIILAFWAIVYTVVSCKLSYVGYARLSRQLFHFIKTRLNDGIQESSVLRQEKRHNTAFKFFSNTEAVELKARDLATSFQDDVDTKPPSDGSSGRTTASVKRDECNRTVAVPNDSIEYRENRLHWIISSLVLFIDKNDVSRIPLEFFWQVCKLDMPGSPGPVHKAALVAVGRICSSFLFLSLLAIVVISFGNMCDITTTNQMILILISGGIPFIIILALYGCGRPYRSRVNDYSLYGKVQRVINAFCQSWPVYDLSFHHCNPAAAATGARRAEEPSQHERHNPRRSGDADDCVNHPGSRLIGSGEMNTELKTLVNGSQREAAVAAAAGNVDSMQVDLLITVKDDQEDENIRSEPVSLGSGMSINSNSRADRMSPEDNQPVSHVTVQGSQNPSCLIQQPSLSCVTNQPTNASRSRMTESEEALQSDAAAVGTFALRKQSSASTLHAQNHVNSGGTEADLVVDMTEDMVLVKRIGFASPRNTVSMRSLPSYKHRSTDATSESAL